MRHTILIALLAAVYATACARASDEPENAGVERTERLVYPAAHRVDQVDEYHGQRVADPYRWLERDGDDTRRWLAAERETLARYVNGLAALPDIERHVREIRDMEFIGLPVRGGKRFFETRTAPGATHSTLWVRTGLDGEARLVLDFAEVISEPLHRASGVAPSRNGEWVVWAELDPEGWGTLELARVADGIPVATERIGGVAGNSAIWSHDHRGFFYQSYGDLAGLRGGDAPRDRLMYHRLGTPPTKDELVYARDDRPNMLFTARLSDHGRFMVLQLNDGDRSRNQVVYRDLRARRSDWVTLIGNADATYRFEGNSGRRFLFSTNLAAPRTRLVAIDPRHPDREHWIEILPERDVPLISVSRVGDRLVVLTTEHARPVVEVRRTDGTLERTLELPVIGAIGGFLDDPDSPVALYTTGNLFDPLTIWQVDVRTGRSILHRRPRTSHDPDDYELRQVFYSAADGSRIPMFLAHRKDVPLRGDHPLFMYGFGHGGWVAFPWFQPHLVAWMDLGGVYALPGLRGGGEYGDEWRDAGTGVNKPTTIADYIAAAEWLIEQGYTSRGKLVANGGSASGVVPAAAIVQRPDLFGAAVIDFSFLDMLRYHEFTRVSGWTRGYGSSENAEEFAVLRSYSPLHNLKEDTCYPATLTIVGEKDSATAPMHGYKFTAALQHVQNCAAPVLLDVIEDGGHYSYGTSIDETVRTEARLIAFLVRALGLDAARPAAGM